MRTRALAVACLVVGAALGALLTDRELRDLSPIRAAHAQTPKVGRGVQKGVYFPNTETLAPDEMRVIALGTGMPTPLTRAQKSAS